MSGLVVKFTVPIAAARCSYMTGEPTVGYVGLRVTLRVMCVAPGSAPLSCQDYPQAAHQFSIEELDSTSQLTTPQPSLYDASCDSDRFAFTIVPQVPGAYLSVLYRGTYVGGVARPMTIGSLSRTGRASLDLSHHSSLQVVRALYIVA